MNLVDAHSRAVVAEVAWFVALVVIPALVLLARRLRRDAVLEEAERLIEEDFRKELE